MRFGKELEEIKQIGEKWGYGNCIDVLSREWCKKLDKAGGNGNKHMEFWLKEESKRYKLK